MAAEYEADFYQWSVETASALEERRFDDVDLQHVAEEISDLGKSERREVSSRLAVIIVHLLKFGFQPEMQTSSWANTLAIQREDLEEMLEDSPSLASRLSELIPRAYRKAVLLASEETGLLRSAFPPDCPFSESELRS